MDQLTPIKDINQASDYKDRLLKLIPGEVVAAYITIDGIIPPEAELAKWVALFVALVLLASIPFYLTRVYEVTNWKQIGFTMGSFLIWLYSLGGPFELWDSSIGVAIHFPYIGSILLILWTLLIPIIVTASATNQAPVAAPAIQN